MTALYFAASSGDETDMCTESEILSTHLGGPHAQWVCPHCSTLHGALLEIEQLDALRAAGAPTDYPSEIPDFVPDDLD